MKICIVSTMFPKYKGDYYGSFVFNDAKMLVENGFEVHVVTQHNPGIPYEEVMDGVHIHRFKWLEPKEFKALIHFKGLKDNVRLISYLISLFFNLIIANRKYKLDIMHAHHAIPTGLIGVIVSKITGTPIFITTHGMDITTHGVDKGPLENVKNFEDHFFFKRLLRFSLNNCNRIIAVSNDLKKRIENLGVNNKITILRNAVDTDRFKPGKNQKIRKKYGITDDEVVTLYVGHIEEFKGIFEMINAFHEVKIQNENVKLIIIGDGSQKDESEKEVSKLGLENHVIFAGKIAPADIHEYYQSSDIFVLPSHTDAGGPPVVFIEAMACGLPVIGTNVGGIPEGIDESHNGFIVPPKNVDELAKKLKMLVNDENLRKKLGNNSLEKINENSMTLKKKIQKLIDLYKTQLEL